MKMTEIEYVKKYKDLTLPEDIEIKCFISKRKRMVRSTRHISTKAAHKIKEKLTQAEHSVLYCCQDNFPIVCENY